MATSVSALPEPAANYNMAALYVGGLHPDVTEGAIFDMFSTVGPVTSIRLCRDAITRRSLCYCYVNFAQPADAERAMETLNFDALNGQPIRIMWSQRDPAARRSGSGNIFIKNLDKVIDNKSIYDTFSLFGTILSCKVAIDEEGRSKGFGFVHFETEDAAEQAIQKVNGMLLAGKQVFVGKFQPATVRAREAGEEQKKFTNVFIKNLEEDVDKEKLEKMFEEFGKSNELRRPITRRRVCSGLLNNSERSHHSRYTRMNFTINGGSVSFGNVGSSHPVRGGRGGGRGGGRRIIVPRGKGGYRGFVGVRHSTPPTSGRGWKNERGGGWSDERREGERPFSSSMQGDRGVLDMSFSSVLGRIDNDSPRGFDSTLGSDMRLGEVGMSAPLPARTNEHCTVSVTGDGEMAHCHARRVERGEEDAVDSAASILGRSGNPVLTEEQKKKISMRGGGQSKGRGEEEEEGEDSGGSRVEQEREEEAEDTRGRRPVEVSPQEGPQSINDIVAELRLQLQQKTDELKLEKKRKRTAQKKNKNEKKNKNGKNKKRKK